MTVYNKENNIIKFFFKVFFVYLIFCVSIPLLPIIFSIISYTIYPNSSIDDRVWIVPLLSILPLLFILKSIQFLIKKNVLKFLILIIHGLLLLFIYIKINDLSKIFFYFKSLFLLKF